MKNIQSLLLCGIVASAGVLLPAETRAASPQDPVLYMIGDSTMANKPVIPPNPERGWGQMFSGYFKDDLRVENHALNGRSTKSFLAEGHWAAITNKLKAGDWVIIQFGHNDEKTNAVGRGTAPFGEFKANLVRYIEEARAFKAEPILATPVVRRAWTNHTLIDTHGDYVEAVRQVARQKNVPLLELHTLSQELVKSLGPEESKKLYLWIGTNDFPNLTKRDDTHFSAYGASRMCDFAAQEIRIKVPVLATHLKMK